MLSGMPTMREMAGEYRLAAAKLAMRIQEERAAGASQARLAALAGALRDIRETQRLLDGYYEAPRSSSLAAVGWKARRTRDDG